jgi:hypothetical protein
MIAVIRRRLRAERAVPAIVQAASVRIATRTRNRPPAAAWPEVHTNPRLARKLYVQLADLVGVPAEYLRPDEALQDLLAVRRTELVDVSDEDWELTGFTEQVQPHAYDLMYLFEHGSDRNAWRTEWNRLEPRPANEEQWIDHLMTLTVEQFVGLAMAVRKSAA